MAFLGDYHTHTKYSRRGAKKHAVGSVMENALAAKKAGLVELAITDHGYCHYYGVSRPAAFAKLKEDCKKAEKITGVKIYAGMENNLDQRSGKNKDLPALMECTPDILSGLEIVQGGYHAMVGTPTIFRNMLFWARNVIFKFLPGRKKLIARNTEAYKRAIDEYPIDFIGHLNRGILADAVEVAKYAHEHGVYIELNGRHKSLSKKQIKQMVEAGVEFICNSDAHCPEAVGTMPLAQKMIEECGIPYSLIANWDRLPSFRSENFKAARQQKSNAVRDDG
ncbi:MAG: PHP domain-containing protein [Clostridiales bacterium]|nr:PHP domain-containing protein [Clostridiales bacterium]